MNLRPGRYACQVTAPNNGWFGEAGEKATPFIRIPLVVTEGSHEGEEVTYQAWITDAAHARTVKNLKEVFEWDGDLVALARQTSGGPFVGKFCSIVCEEEEHKGKKRVVIKWLNGPNGADSLMDANKALQLASRLMGHKEPDTQPAKPRSAYGQQGAQKPPPDPDLDGDDIPF